MKCSECAQPIEFNFGESKFLHVPPQRKECPAMNPLPGEQSND